MSELIRSGLLVSCALGFSDPAAAGDAMTLNVTYKADVVASTGSDARFLDNLDAVVDLDLGRALHWSGAKAQLHLLSNAGDAPNDAASTLQGIDNIEVERQRAKIYQAWIEQGFAGDASLRFGLYDLNSEFYVTEAAGLLIAPAFGIGSELAATGPNGPSIFPSTALALRADWRASDTLTLRAAALNARAGVIGDPGSVNIDFADGALLIAEASMHGRADMSIGGWRYTSAQDDIRDLDSAGAPRKRAAQGAYASFEYTLPGDESGPRTTAFARIGVSDGDTTLYAGGWQSGLSVEGITPGRPDSKMSVGVYQGVLASKFRSNERDVGRSRDRAESSVEITYSDAIAPHISVQPDIQYFPNPGAEAGRDAVWVGAVRLTVNL